VLTMLRRDRGKGKRPRLHEPGPNAQKVIGAMLARGARCVLCDRAEPEVAGVWFPPPGSGRWRELWYMLCAACFGKPGVQQRAEDSLRRRLALPGNCGRRPGRTVGRLTGGGRRG